MSDIDRFFKLDDKTKDVTFTGDKLQCLIPLRYMDKNQLILGDKIQSLGIFTMIINDKIKCGLQIPAVITIDAVKTYQETIDGVQYFICELHKGNKLLESTMVIKNNMTGYFMWVEFFTLGNMPSYISYANAANLFDDVKEVTGLAFNPNRAILGVIAAHLFRDRKDLSKPYRLTDMKEPPKVVSLRTVAYGPSSTQGKIIGSYAQDGLNGALINQADSTSELEELYRA